MDLLKRLFVGGGATTQAQQQSQDGAMVNPGVVVVNEDALPDVDDDKKNNITSNYQNDYLGGFNDEQLTLRYANALRAMHRKGTNIAFDPYTGPEGLERARADSKLMADFVKMNVEEQRAMLTLLEAPDGPLNHANQVSDTMLELVNKTLESNFGFEGDLSSHDPIVGFSRYLVRFVGTRFPGLIQAGSAASAIYECAKSISADSAARKEARARAAKRKRDDMERGASSASPVAGQLPAMGGSAGTGEASRQCGLLSTNSLSNNVVHAPTSVERTGANPFAESCRAQFGDDASDDGASQCEESDAEEIVK
jgi:hypothetical protein